MLVPDGICTKGSKQESSLELRNMIAKPEAKSRIIQVSVAIVVCDKNSQQDKAVLMSQIDASETDGLQSDHFQL